MGICLILDTETTGLDDDREIIEVAWIRPIEVGDLAGPSDQIPRPVLPEIEAPNDGRCFERRYKPTRAIGFGAMAVHHILPAELEQCPPSSEFALPEGVEYIVGHNCDFDHQAIGSPAGIKRICTDAMARWIWQDCDSYSQSALLYRLLGPTPETRELLKGAHGAMTDVLNNARLLEEILSETGITSWQALWEYSEQCRVPRVLAFGKYKGTTLDELVEIDGGYVDWLLRQDWTDEYLVKGLHQAIKRMNEKWSGAPAGPF
jgi:exodeoxyribonuclease X